MRRVEIKIPAIKQLDCLAAAASMEMVSNELHKRGITRGDGMLHCYNDLERNCKTITYRLGRRDILFLRFGNGGHTGSRSLARGQKILVN